MKLIAALGVATLAMAPVAQAQSVCEEVGWINEAAIEHFDTIKGPYLPGRSADELFESDAALFGGYDCVIDQYFEPRHVCTWEFDSEAEVMSAYAAKAAAIAPCLAGWEEEALFVHDPEEPYRVLAGVGYLGAGAYEPIVWSVLADFDVGRDGKRYRLVIETVDYS